MCTGPNTFTAPSKPVAKPSAVVEGAGVWDRLRCLGMIAMLFCLIPFTVMCVVMSTARFQVRRMLGLEPAELKKRGPMCTVLLTGGKMSKTLAIARAVKRSSVPTRVVLVETEKFRFCGARFSNCVDAFETVRCPRRDGGEAYSEDLVKLFARYGVDVFIPVSSPAAAVWDSKAKQLAAAKGLSTKCLHFNPFVTDMLDDKDAFGRFCREKLQMEAMVPETIRVSSDEDALTVNQNLQDSPHSFIIKNLQYDPLHRLDLFRLPCDEASLKAYLAKIRADGNPITQQEPWQVQQFIQGKEYSAFAVLRDTKVQALTVCESSPSQLNYRHVDVPCIEAWVEAFVSKCRGVRVQLDGQLCWDFIVDEKETAWPLECNPRVHSQICVYRSNEGELGNALLNGRATPLYPPNSNKHAAPAAPEDFYWMYNELMKVFPNNALLKYNPAGAPHATLAKAAKFLNTLVFEQEADLDAKDPLPFVLRNHLQIPLLLLDTCWAANEWTKLDFNIGKVVEKNGD